MRILLCHNFYQQPGGEDQVFEDETALLESHGHEVIRYTLHNNSIEDLGKFDLARKTLWNKESANEIQAIINKTKPEVMHCTNVFPLISPAAYYTAKQENVAVVQTLHNYRTICPNALFLKQGKACESCLGKSVAWPAIVNACYRNSRTATAAVVAMQAFHWAKKTWTKQVDRYIALTEFSKQKHIEGGFPAEIIDVKPNFVNPDPGIGNGKENYVVYVGRLSEEKGIRVLLDTWKQLKSKTKLIIVGDGPLASLVQQAESIDQRINWVGRKAISEVYDIIGNAACLVLPSITYETFGRTIVEAYAKGTPVIVSRQGAMQELVIENQTGKLFEPGNADDLAKSVEHILSNDVKLSEMRGKARLEYEDKYQAETNYHQLISVYERALENYKEEPVKTLMGATS